MYSKKLQALFEKLKVTQLELDELLEAPSVIASSDIEQATQRETVTIKAIIIAMDMPATVARLKAASMAAQKADEDLKALRITQEVRDEAARKAAVCQGEMVQLLNKSLQSCLQEFNARLENKLFVEFDLRSARALCAAL